MVMIATQLKLDLLTPTGEFLLTIPRKDLMTFNWVLKTNAIGALVVQLPYFYYGLIKVESRFAFYRSIAGGLDTLEGETQWLVRKITQRLTENGEQFIIIEAYPAICILNRRIVDYASGSAQASKTAVALDNMAKGVVRENFSTLATDILRRIPITAFTVQADLTLAPTGSKAFARQRVMAVLQEIAQDSTTRGTYMAFDVVWTGSLFEFRTYIGGRGPDNTRNSGNPVIFNPEFRNLSDVTIVEDYTEEYNYITAAGSGAGGSRLTQPAFDLVSINASDFNRSEYLEDSRDTGTTGQLTSDANAALRANAPKKIFTGAALQTENSLYGLHYQFGSQVSVECFGQQFDCRIEAVQGSVSDGKEEINIALQSVA